MAVFSYIFRQREELLALGAAALDIGEAVRTYQAQQGQPPKPFIISAIGSHDSGKSAIWDGLLQHGAGLDPDRVQEGFRHDEEHQLAAAFPSISSARFSAHVPRPDQMAAHDLCFLTNSHIAETDMCIGVYLNKPIVHLFNDPQAIIPNPVDALPSGLKGKFMEACESADAKGQSHFLRLVTCGIRDEWLAVPKVAAIVQSLGFAGIHAASQDNFDMKLQH